MTTAIIVLSLALAVALGYIITLTNRCASLRNDVHSARVEAARQAERLDVMVNEHERREAAAEARFKNLAHDIFSAKNAEMQQANDKHLADIIGPMKENLENFRRQFTAGTENESRQRSSLAAQIRELVEASRLVGREAHDLSTALRGNTRVQGQWGEMILENLLTGAGLEPGREFKIQQTVNDASGRRLRADAVINLPDGRCLVIDSKVSLTAYMQMAETSDPNAMQEAVKAHVASVKSHINELASKNYQDAIGHIRADFVLMFIPHEGAYLAAMKADGALWDDAFGKRVIIASPTHLLTVIKLADQLWRHDRQTRHAIDIAVEAGRMIDKFRLFVDDIEKIDRALNNSRAAIDSARRKLSTGPGNLVARAEKLRRLGAKASKTLPGHFTGEAEDDYTAADTDEKVQRSSL